MTYLFYDTYTVEFCIRINKKIHLKEKLLMKLKSRGISTQLLDDELLVNDSEKGQVHVLNKTATVIWEEIKLRHSTRQIEEKLKKLYNVNSNEDIKKQVLATLADFKKKGLLLDDE